MTRIKILLLEWFLYNSSTGMKRREMGEKSMIFVVMEYMIGTDFVFHSVCNSVFNTIIINYLESNNVSFLVAPQ